MPTVPREKYPEINWRAADKVAAWRAFKRQMNVIFVADQVPEERQWALILVTGGDEAYNHWDTLEETVEDHKKVDQVWDAFEKSSEQSTSFWHFRDAYLADFRQDELETKADLDLCIKQTVRGCQWKKETKEERMIDLLYHATIYYEIRKFVQESEPAALTYELVIEKAKAHERNILEYKDHQASHGGANSAPSYNNPLLSAHALSKRRPNGTDSSSSETSSESSSQPSSNASSPETSSSASTSWSTSPELLELERSFNSLLAGTRDRQGHPMTRSQMDNLRDQQQHIAILKQVASQPQNQPRPVSVPPVANMPLPLYPQRHPSDKGSKKQVQAENANAPCKSSDSETDRLQDIQEGPRRCIGPSRVKELAKFFTPTSDEEENSRVNNRTRCKKLFEPKKEEESEK